MTYSKDEGTTEPRNGYVPILRAGNISDDGRINFTDLVYVPENRVRQAQYVRRGDVVIATSSGSIDVVGKSAQATQNLGSGFGAFCKVLRPSANIDPRYFGHYFRTNAYRRKVSALAAGANINNLRNEHISNLKILLPSLEMQRQIVAVLDKIDELRVKRRQTLFLLNDLAKSIFFDMFGDPVKNSVGWDDSLLLGDVADVVSGITKGRKLPESPRRPSTRVVPYLAVANVQHQALELDNVKEIEATDAEIERYRLRAGDLLLTEGGDPDKLGRGTLWRNEIAECIHQNHIFRVRMTSRHIRPDFASWLLASERGRRYFLKSAKQTTGIASINAGQLRSFPLLVPPLELQDIFAERITAIESRKATQRAQLATLDELFASAQYKAFQGELFV